MRLLQRLQLRMFVNRRIRQTNDPEERAALGTMLADGSLFQDVGDALVREQETGRPLTDFLQWLLDNQEGIIAFIKAIIALFSGLARTGGTGKLESSVSATRVASVYDQIVSRAKVRQQAAGGGFLADFGSLIDIIAEIIRDGSFNRGDMETIIAAAEQAFDTFIAPLTPGSFVDRILRAAIRPSVTQLFDLLFPAKSAG